jgi:hypothetical protein
MIAENGDDGHGFEHIGLFDDGRRRPLSVIQASDDQHAISGDRIPRPRVRNPSRKQDTTLAAIMPGWSRILNHGPRCQLVS